MNRFFDELSGSISLKNRPEISARVSDRLTKFRAIMTELASYRMEVKTQVP